MPKGQHGFCPSLSNFLGGPDPCKSVASLLCCISAPKPEYYQHHHVLGHDQIICCFVDLLLNLRTINKMIGLWISKDTKESKP